MTVETGNCSAAQAQSERSANRGLWETIETRLWSDGSVAKLDPYQTTMADVERYEAFAVMTSGRGRRYARCTFDNLRPPATNAIQFRRVVHNLRKFCEAMPDRLSAAEGSVVLLGPPGTGKDHMLVALMGSAIVDHGFQVQWSDGLRLYAQIKAAISSNNTEDLLRAYSNVQILALSDPVPPRDELSSYEMMILRDIIERRYSTGRATWVTTNVMTPDDAKRLFTEALLGRIRHGALELFCNWESHRTTQRDR